MYLFDYFSPSSITHKRGFGALRGRHLVVDERCTAKIQTSRGRGLIGLHAAGRRFPSRLAIL